MLPFLEGYLKNLTAIQSKQIFRILSQMRDKGEIRDSLEFEKKLEELATLVQKENLGQRTPAFAFSEGELLDSDSIRTFIEYVKLDLEASLGETERLSNSIRAHSKILSNNYFDALEAVVTELERETTAYEILEFRKYNGFGSVLKRYSFNGVFSVPGANRGDPFSSSLFIDSRGKQKLYYSPPKEGESGIHLPVNVYSVEESCFFDKIEILTDSTTPQTSLSAATKKNTPLNAVDGSDYTFWKTSVFLPTYPDYCRLIVAPSFTGSKRVNALVLSPLADVALKVVALSYIDSGGNEIKLPVGTNYSEAGTNLFTRSGHLNVRTFRNSDWIIPNRKIVIPVGDITVRKFKITFQQDTAVDGNLFYNKNDLGDWEKGTSIENFIINSREEGNNLDGAHIPKELGIITDEDERIEESKTVEYVFGLKEISTYSREYEQNGVFVPESFKVKKPIETLAVHSDIDFPDGYLCSLEMNLKKENYDSDGNLIDTENIPILPYGENTTYERLFLTRKYNQTLAINDSGSLRFYPDFSESIIVYNNGVALTLGTDYTISVDEGTTFESVIPPTETEVDPKKCIVKILSPQTRAVYVIKYSPLLSSTTAGSEIWLNEDHTVLLDRYQTYNFVNTRSSTSITNSKLGLQVILRANTLDKRISPYLRELVILSG